MFGRKRKVYPDGLEAEVREYLKKNYIEPVRPEPEKPSFAEVMRENRVREERAKAEKQEAEKKPSEHERGDLQYSRRESDVRYSLAMDTYDEDLIDSAIQDRAVFSPFDPYRSFDIFTNMSFAGKLLQHIRIRGLRDPDVYRAAQIDRRLYSKIISDRTYKPSKDTCIALCCALKLSLEDTTDMLSRAGFTLSRSIARDVILEFFFRKGIYDLFRINETLCRFDQKPLGRY